MGERYFSYSEMQEHLPDYIFGRLSPLEREIFERTLPNFPDITEEIERVRKVFARLEKMNVDKFIDRKTRDIHYKVQAKWNKQQKAFGVVRLPSFRIVLATVGVVIIALSLFLTKNSRFVLNLNPLQTKNISMGDLSEKVNFEPLQLLDETEANQILENFIADGSLDYPNPGFFVDPVLELGKINEFSTFAENLIEEHIIESLDIKQSSIYNITLFSFNSLFNELENLNEDDFKQLIKELENVSS